MVPVEPVVVLVEEVGVPVVPVLLVVGAGHEHTSSGASLTQVPGPHWASEVQLLKSHVAVNGLQTPLWQSAPVWQGAQMAPSPLVVPVEPVVEVDVDVDVLVFVLVDVDVLVLVDVLVVFDEVDVVFVVFEEVDVDVDVVLFDELLVPDVPVVLVAMVSFVPVVPVVPVELVELLCVPLDEFVPVELVPVEFDGPFVFVVPLDELLELLFPVKAHWPSTQLISPGQALQTDPLRPQNAASGA